ncbi:430d98cd-2ba1-4497-8085-3012c0a48a1d [Sclerotinia trifoliorum]|uniref:430d98cd-2ba1-4497-8085-3012c0a48a1d n=1 Tax=Sclerotinia trifoliorum TaxID=28548 RepID=A0A8H2VL08_9HELO|nr:430d98cd-2ba1-4497-8085-3012c0a48a1d [Sclerotinia trifoliorum]
MAAYENTTRPRKTITTYGKPSRKHLAGHSYAKLVHRAIPPDLTKTGIITNNEPSSSNHERAPNAYSASPSTTSAPKTKSAVDLYDVPLSDDEDPPLMRKNVTKSAQRVKVKSAMFDVLPSDEEGQSTMRKKFPKLKQKALQNSSIYDMSLSEDEIPPSARKNPSKLLPKANEKPTTIRRVKHSNITAPANNDLEGMPEHKKRKLSPAGQPRQVPAKLPVVPLKEPPNPQNRKAQSISNAPPKRLAVHTKPISHSDPKQSTVLRGLQRQRNIAPQSQVLKSPASTDSDISLQLAARPKHHMSPKAAELGDALLDKDHETEGAASTSGDELSLFMTKPKKPYPMARKLSKSAAVAKPTSITPRKRLIDSLVKQAPHQDSDEEEDDDDDESGKEHDNSQLEDHFQHLHNSRVQSLTPEPQNFTTSAQASQGSQITGPKFTYSRQRSMLVEEDMMEQLAFDMPLETPQGSQRRRGSIPSLKPLLSFREDEEGEDEAANTTIRTIHELRQAGANSRFADEVEDLLDRIGKPTAKPSSLRRSGLLDLGIKMKDKAFVRQFRAHGAEQRLFVDLGEEIDVVSGFLMISLVTPILAEGSVPLVVSQLQRQGISKLLNRLISVEKSIISVTKERKTNMSKMAQNSISAYHDFLLEISAWKDLSPVELSPRTLALKCLELMVRQSREAGDASDIISEELNTSLFEILTSSDNDASWHLPHGTEAIDFYLTLSTLESHSLVARTTQDETIWLHQLLPIIGNALNTALNRPLDSFGEQQILALKLTLNVTNHNPKACDAIANSDLMYTILRVVVAKFKRMSNLWAEEEIIVAVDNLILLIGAMINFALWSPKALKNIDKFAGAAQDPLDELIRLFVDNREKTFEADSQHESHKNVPLGYLSVLLGHFCLLPAIEKRIRMRQRTKTLRPLITSINEFIVYHKAADDEISPSEEGRNPHVTVTKQFEDLVKKLLQIKGADA